LRGEAVAEAALRLRNKGWHPDVIIGHPGWGELLFIRDIWPTAKLVVNCEYYYNAEGQDFNFDPEFQDSRYTTVERMKLKKHGNVKRASGSRYILHANTVATPNLSRKSASSH